jgi:hypothetical protein
MHALTRRRQNNRAQESWHIYYGDTCVGWIGKRAGTPMDFEKWGWHCGFYPVTHRGLRFHGVAETSEDARGAFEKAWRRCLSSCAEEDFDEHRYHRAFTAWKQRMWDTGCSLPTQAVNGMTKCFCGAMISYRTREDHIRARHMEITA